MLRQWSLPSYFASKTQKKFAALLFFLAACNKKFQRANGTDIIFYYFLVIEIAFNDHQAQITATISRLDSEKVSFDNNLCNFG